MDTMLSEILFESSLLFIVIGSLFALAFGLGLILYPEATLRFNSKINTRISMRQKTRLAETPIKSEPYFYRYSKLSGSLLIAGSCYLIYTLVTFEIDSIIPFLPVTVDPLIWKWLLDATVWFFLISGLFILIFGLLVLIRPSALKGFEQKANTWISTRRGFQGMSHELNFLNKLVLTYPRSFGIYICIFSVIVLIFLLPAI